MKLRLVFLSVVLTVGWPLMAVASAPAVAALAAQPDAGAAKTWLADRFPTGAYVGDDVDFFDAASEVLDDPEAEGVRLFVYLSAEGSAGESAWVAWVGLDDAWFVVLLDSTEIR